MSLKYVWGDNSSTETGQKIYRSETPMDVNNLPAPLAIVAPDLEEYIDTTAVDGTLYYCRVSSFNGTIEKVSAEVSITASAGGGVTTVTLDPALLGAGLVLSNGDLTVTKGGLAFASSFSTESFSSGKIYTEITHDDTYTGSHVLSVGITSDRSPGLNLYTGATSTSWGYYAGLGRFYNNGVSLQTVTPYVVTDILTILLNLDDNELSFKKNNVVQGTPITIPAGTYYITQSNQASQSTINFGASAFNYAIDSGYSSADGSQTG